MNTKLLLLAVAAAFTTASCSQEKKTETVATATTPVGTEATTATTTTTPAVDTAAYRSTADQLADRVATDLKVTDAAVKDRLKQVYYTRGRVMQNIAANTDTAGHYLAMKAANDLTTSQVKTIVTDPAAYRTYTDNQGNYYAGPYTTLVIPDETAATIHATAPAHKPSLGARVGHGSGVKKMENTDDNHKVKYENGAKIKRSDDGSLKIKRADGTKVKIDEHGHKTVKKGLF
ncbi:MAG: hypothetical protein ACRYFX_05000 [Janthinobacterium lividum]